jgi:glycosyltransferase involved in cell wall biosynthesis
MTAKKVSIVIPSLNEEITVGKTIKRVQEAISKYKIKNYEVLLIDASSTDKTVEIASREGAQVHVVPKVGLGYQYMRSLEWITGDYVIMGDSDGTYDFMEMDRFIKKLDEGYDFVMGTRLKGNIHKGAMPWSHQHIGTPFLTFFIKLFYRTGISDCNSGLRALTTEAFRKIQLESPGWEYASEMVVKASLCNLKITEVPVSLLPDAEGRTPHLTPWKAAYNNLKVIFLLASDKIFIKAGTILFLLGLFIYASQLAGPITILGVFFGTYYLFLGLMLTIIGISAVQMGLLTHSFSYLRNFSESKLDNTLREKFSFEKGINISLILFIFGFGIDIFVLIRWLGSGNIKLFDIKLGLYSLLFIISSIQLVFFSFTYYIFKRRPQ